MGGGGLWILGPLNIMHTSCVRPIVEESIGLYTRSTAVIYLCLAVETFQTIFDSKVSIDNLISTFIISNSQC